LAHDVGSGAGLTMVRYKIWREEVPSDIARLELTSYPVELVSYMKDIVHEMFERIWDSDAVHVEEDDAEK